MSDRPVRLDLSTGGLADFQSSHSNAGGEREAASDEQIARFRDALSGEAALDSSAPDNGRRPAEEAPPQARGAFGLFGRARWGIEERFGNSAASAAAGATNDRDAGGNSSSESAQQIASEVAERILVSADGGREVRIAIREDVMPGVEVNVSQEQGRWIVDCTASEASSYELLERSGSQLAADVAARLRAGVEVRLTKGPAAASEPDHVFLAEAPAAGAP